MARFTVWTSIEASLAIICASIPTLKPLISRYLPNLGAATIHSSRETSKDGSPSRSWQNSPRIPNFAYPFTNVSSAGRPVVRRASGHLSERADSVFLGANDDEELIGEREIIRTTDICVSVKYEESWSETSIDKVAPIYVRARSRSED